MAKHNNGHKNASSAPAPATVGQKVVIEKLSSITLAALEQMASEGYTCMADGRFSADFKIPPAKGHWKYMLVPSSKGPDFRMLVLLPNSTQTRAIWMKGQVKMAERAGLSATHAEAWAHSSLGRRHELLERLVGIMNDPVQIAAYREFNKETVYPEWVNKHQIRDGLSTVARLALVAQIEELLAADEKVRRLEEEAKNPQITLNPMLDMLTTKRETKVVDDLVVSRPTAVAEGGLPLNAIAASNATAEAMVAEDGADEPEQPTTFVETLVEGTLDDAPVEEEPAAQQAMTISDYTSDDDIVSTATLAGGAVEQPVDDVTASSTAEGTVETGVDAS